MNDSSNPFQAWQQFWQQSTQAATPFMPPTNAAEAEQKITELENIELWLQFQLQAIGAQKALLQQQKAFFESMNPSSSSN